MRHRRSRIDHEARLPASLIRVSCRYAEGVGGGNRNSSICEQVYVDLAVLFAEPTMGSEEPLRRIGDPFDLVLGWGEVDLANGTAIPITSGSYQRTPDNGLLAFRNEDGTVKVSLLTSALFYGKPECHLAHWKPGSKVSRDPILKIAAWADAAPSSCSENSFGDP